MFSLTATQYEQNDTFELTFHHQLQMPCFSSHSEDQRTLNQLEMSYFSILTLGLSRQEGNNDQAVTYFAG